MKIWMLAVPLLLVITGCRGVETHNITVSTSIRKVAEGEEKIDSMEDHALVCFFTDEKNPVQFYLKKKPKKRFFLFHRKKADNNSIGATATIDKDSYAAFFVTPGTYCFQNASEFTFPAGSVTLLYTDRQKTCIIPENKFPRGVFLSKKMVGDGKNILTADSLVPDFCGPVYRTVYYSAKTLKHTILVPWYILYGTSFVVCNMSKGAMASGHPGGMVGGALFYCLTFWADEDPPGALCYSGEFMSPQLTTSSVSPNTETANYIAPNQKTQFDSPNIPSPTYTPSYSPVKENAFGPGLHQDQYGRPVRYTVPNWPANEPTQHLQVRPNVYGPGVGEDQFGRPVRMRRAF